MNSNLIQSVQFADNPESRAPCLILVDTSGSMAGAPISELNQGLQELKVSLLEDPLASKRVEIALVGFNHHIAVEQDFDTVDAFNPPPLTASGGTSMGAAVEKALDMIEARKSEYRANGISYYRPWVFLITDGEPTDDTSNASDRIKDAEANKRLAFFGVGVQGANMVKLEQLCTRPPVKLDRLAFREMFVWLSRSLQRIAASRPGDQISLPAVGWSAV